MESNSVRCDYTPGLSSPSVFTSTPASLSLAPTLSQSSVIFNPSDQSNKLVHFDLKTNVESVLELDMQKAFIPKAVWVMLVERETLLVCGGLEREGKKTVLGVHIPSCLAMELGEMIEGRGEAGIIQTQERVYLFGGRNPDLMKSCETFDLQTDQWRRLGEMTVPRAGMTPVIWKTSILIVGGVGSSGMDVFSLENEQFHPVDLKLPYSDQLTLSFVANDQLISLQRDQILGANLRGGNRSIYVVSRMQKPGFWFSPTEIVKIEDRFLFLDWACASSIWSYSSTTNDLTVASNLT